MYELRLENPRIKVYEIAQYLNVTRNTVYKRWKKAMENGILFNPQLRLKMVADVKEHVYVISSDTAFRTYNQFKKDSRLCYETFATGYIDLLFITSEPLPQRELTSLGTVVLDGTRSTYICPRVPATQYETAMSDIEDFAQQDFEPSHWIVEYPPRDIVWKRRDWELFSLLLYDMTKKYTELAKSIKMSYDGFRWSLRRILANTQVIVPYYPEGYSRYTRFLFMFQSKHEQMLIDLFSMVPCFTMLYKVKDWLLVHFRIVPYDLTDRFFNVIYGLQDRGYIDRIKTTFPITYQYPD
jgi:DNA-binding Lrp family transcriptional regulator